MKKLKIGIIGCGVISSVHLPIINETEILVSICDINEEKGKTLAKKYNCKFYKDYEEMFNNENLDVIHILTPHHIRYSIVKKAIDKNINIIIEKPLAHTYEEAKKIVNLIENQNKVKATVIFQNRKNNSYISLKNELNNKSLGKILGIESTLFWNRENEYYSSSPWRGNKKESGGGLLINQAIHTIDWIQDIGGDISSISGKIFNLNTNNNINVEDSCSFNIVFKNNIKAFFSGTLTNFKNTDVSLKIYCEKGVYSLREKSLFKKSYCDNVENKIITDEKGFIKDYYGNSHKKIIEEFYKDIKENKNNHLNIKEGLKSLKIINEIYKGCENI